MKHVGHCCVEITGSLVLDSNINPSLCPVLGELKSDPHFASLSGNETFDFDGEPGKMYSLVKDEATKLIINAEFAQAYTTSFHSTVVDGVVEMHNTRPKVSKGIVLYFKTNERIV